MKKQNLKLEVVSVENPDAKNFILGQSHFIKSVEDIHEALVTAVPNIQFGLAFCEASGPRLVRTSGTNEAMVKLAAKNALKVGCGHVFFIFLENAFPINVLNAVKMVPEVVGIYCATANPCQVVVGQTTEGGAVLGVIDGGKPAGVEKDSDIAGRRAILRKFGYKL